MDVWKMITEIFVGEVSYRILEENSPYTIAALIAFSLCTLYYSGVGIGLFAITASLICILSPLFSEDTAYYMNIFGFGMLLVLMLMHSKEYWATMYNKKNKK